PPGEAVAYEVHRCREWRAAENCDTHQIKGGPGAATGRAFPRFKAAIWKQRNKGVLYSRKLRSGGFGPLGARAGERCLAEQMLGGAADAIRLDRGGKFETHSHRLRYLGRPAESVAVHLAVADRRVVIAIGQRSRQRRPFGLEI